MSAKITASADGTYGSLGVGATEAFRFGSDNSGQLAGFRNKIINGGMQVAQRGSTAVSSIAVTYGGADRTFFAASGFSAISGTLTGATGVSGTVTGSAQRMFVSSTTGSGTAIFGQRIESANSIPLNGKTITVSCKVFQNTGSAVTTYIQINKANALDNFTTGTAVANGGGVSVASGVWTPLAFTTTLGATDASNGLEVEAIFSGLGALSSKDFYIGDFQVELGSIATPFEQRPIGLELSLCQRYYEIGSNYIYNQVAGSTTVGIGTRYKVTKRASPPSVGLTAGTCSGGDTDSFHSYLAVASGSWYQFSFTADAEL